MRKRIPISTRTLQTVACLIVAAALPCGCSSAAPRTEPPNPETRAHLRIEALIASAYWASRDRTAARPPACPAYLQALLADNRLTIGLGVGTADLGDIAVPIQPADKRCRMTVALWGRAVAVEGRLITTNEEFAAALAECELVFVQSHSRFGAGPVFYSDGKSRPYRMQQRRDYEIVMPEEEVSGYRGRVKRAYFDPRKGKQYTVFEPDGSDLEAATPLHGYQIIVLSTCSSKKHFQETLTRFRGIYPTTAILTTQPCCMDESMEVFASFLSGIFRGQPINAVVAGMNETYNSVAQRRVRRKMAPWKPVEQLYTIGLQTLQ